MTIFSEICKHIPNKKRKRVLATRPTYQFDSSVQIISLATFEAAVPNLRSLSNSAVPTIAVTVPPTSDDKSGSSLQLISREAFEATVPKVPKTPKKSNDPWSRSRRLGEAAYGVVYLALRNDNVGSEGLPQQMAIKCAPLFSASTLIDEERILRSFSSPYIVSCYGSKITKAESRPSGFDYNLILEYCAGGSIADYLRFRGQGIVEEDVKLFAFDILKGINYIHSQKYIHCDIKPGNILLKPQDQRPMPNGFEPKIADFGLAIRTTSDEYVDGEGFRRGTLLYMSPELLRDGTLDYGTDIWAYGCTVLEMLTGERPWNELGIMNKSRLRDRICSSNIKPEIPTWISNDAKDFLQKCLEIDPSKRYGSLALWSHGFLTSVHGDSGAN